LAPHLLVSQVIDVLRPDFVSSGLELIADILTALPLVLAEPDLIGYVLSNLLSNTLKFVPAGGKVEVSVNAFPDGMHLVLQTTVPGFRTNIFQNCLDDSSVREHHEISRVTAWDSRL
jgi:signal transduction histidine kinase